MRSYPLNLSDHFYICAIVLDSTFAPTTNRLQCMKWNWDLAGATVDIIANHLRVPAELSSPQDVERFCNDLVSLLHSAAYRVGNLDLNASPCRWSPSLSILQGKSKQAYRQWVQAVSTAITSQSSLFSS